MTLPYIIPLTGPDLRAAGIPEPWAFGMSDRVRFGELDVLNHVNNVAYLSWFETLRVIYLEEYGIYRLSGLAPKFVVKTVSADYHAEIKRGATYIMTARTVEMRNTSFTMEYGVFVDGKLTTTGTAVIVLLNEDNTKRALPDPLRQMFVEKDGAVQA